MNNALLITQLFSVCIMWACLIWGVRRIKNLEKKEIKVGLITSHGQILWIDADERMIANLETSPNSRKISVDELLKSKDK